MPPCRSTPHRRRAATRSAPSAKEGRSAWPAVALDADAFVSWAHAHIATDTPTDKLHPDDLYIVAAALPGAPKAARTFIEGPLTAAESAVTKVLLDPVARAELMQELAVHLLTPGESADPRLGQYDGRAPLRAWLRMTAARRALNKTRGKTRLVDFDAVALDKASDHYPELSVLRRIHRDDIAAIFRDAIAAIPAEERTLLRLHYVQGSTLAELAAIRRVSKSALHRQMDGIREALFARIAALVRQRIRLDESQQGSMLRIFQSDFREALGQMLRDG